VQNENDPRGYCWKVAWTEKWEKWEETDTSLDIEKLVLSELDTYDSTYPYVDFEV
jgi:hypothetical protein